jgi:hypothetical protein
VAGGREANRVGALGSCDEAGGDAGGKAEQICEPVAGDLLDDGRRWRRQVVVGRLVPGRDEQLGGCGGGKGAADDEPEVARTGGGDDRRLKTGDQLVDHARGRHGVLGHGASDGIPHVVKIDSRKDGRVGRGGAVLGHMGRRAGEQRTEVFRHAARLSPCPCPGTPALGLDGSPTATAKLTGELFRRQGTQHLLLGGLPPLWRSSGNGPVRLCVQ